ncbi:1830_t:CDS:2, partial [Paraglomus brasilianum]
LYLNYSSQDKYKFTAYDYNALLSDTLLGLYSLELKDFARMAMEKARGSKKGRLCDFYSFTDFDVDDGAIFVLITLQLLSDSSIYLINKNKFFKQVTTEGRYYYSLNDCFFYGFESTTAFTEHLRKCFKSEHVKKVHVDVWVTAVTLWYMRLVA